jgi:hypothetical protein
MFGKTEDGTLVLVVKDKYNSYADEVKTFNESTNRNITLNGRWYEVLDIKNGYYLDLSDEEGYIYPAGITFEDDFDNWHNDENTIFYYLKEIDILSVDLASDSDYTYCGGEYIKNA